MKQTPPQTESQRRRAARGEPVRRRSIGIRFIVTAATVVLLAGSVLGVTVVAERNARTALSREIDSRLMLLARDVAMTSAGALLADFPELTLQPLALGLQAAHPELAIVVVVDHQGHIQGHTDAAAVGQPFQLPADLVPMPTDVRLANGETLTGNSAVIVAAVAVHRAGTPIGRAIVGLRRDYVDAAVHQARRQQLLLASILLLVGVASALVLMTALLRPIGALRQGLERIGRGDLDTVLEVRARTEFGILAAAVNDMARHLKFAQTQMLEKDRLAHEMDLARDIQCALLPASATVAGDFRIVGAHRAAAEIGGDYFDVLALPDGTRGVAVADVAGKGLAGCLVMSMVAALLRSLCTAHSSPSRLLVALEAQLVANLRPGTFVTMFYARLDPRSGRLTYASAGHCTALLYRADSAAIEHLRSGGIPLGAVRGGLLATTLEDHSVDFAPGDVLVQYTDGVSEAWAPRHGGEQFGIERIEAVVRSHAPFGCNAVLNALRGGVDEWTGDAARADDETLLVLGRALASIPARPPGIERRDTSASSVRTLWDRRHSGPHLALRANPTELRRISGWIERALPVDTFGAKATALLESGLYELCGNIIEHGYDSDGAGQIDVWWIAREEDGRDVVAGREVGSGRIPPAAARPAGHAGHFLVRDHGKPYDPTAEPAPDLDDIAARLRGRGLGLSIVRAAMSALRYESATRLGNLTVLQFDPMRHETIKEVADVCDGT